MEEEIIKEEILQKAGFPIYQDYWDKYLKKLSGDQVKEVFRIVFHFSSTYEIEESDDLAVEMVISTIIDNLKRDALKRSKQSKANRDNGKKGGRPKKANETQDKPNKPNGLLDSKKDSKLSVPDFVDPSLWNEYLKGRKKPTEYAVNLLVKKIVKWKEEGLDPNDSLRHSVENGYVGLFKPKQIKQSASSRADEIMNMDLS